MLSSQEFKDMTSYQPYADNQKKKKTIKRKLIAKIIEVYGETYYRLKEGTRQAIDMMCWLSAERGFVFAGDDYLGNRHDITDRTIRNVAKKLRQEGLIITLYRKSTKHNGKGAPVHLFVDHPYFNHWVDYLNIDFQTDFQAENSDNPCESKDGQAKKISTYNLPLKPYIKSLRKGVEKLPLKFTPSFIPKSFVEAAESYSSYAKDIYKLWGTVKKAYHISKLNLPVEEYLHIVLEAYYTTFFRYKNNDIKKEYTAYFFGTLRNLFSVQKRREVNKASNYTLLYNFLED